VRPLATVAVRVIVGFPYFSLSHIIFDIFKETPIFSLFLYLESKTWRTKSVKFSEVIQEISFFSTVSKQDGVWWEK